MTTYQDIAANVRLSPQQRLCWQGNLPAPTLVLDILGEFNQAQWQQRLNTLMAEHEPLRTGLHYQQGLQVPLLAIEPAGEVALKKIENQEAFQGLQAHLTQHKLSLLKEQEGQQETGMQAYFVRLNEEHHQVYLSLPPLSADKGTLLRLAQALSDHSSDIKTDNAEDDSTPYSHYSAWLYELQEDEDAEEGHQYWSKQCPDKWQPQGLVYEQSTGLENQLSEISLTVNTDIEQMLSVFGQQHNINTETVLITAWASLLQRLSRDLDQDNHAIPLGWVHDCRQDYEELADSWGLFSKTLPLPWQSKPEESFLSALTRMQGYQEIACEWQEYYAIEADANPFHTRFGFESIELSSSTMATASTTGQNQISIARLSAHNQHFDMLLAPLRDDNGKLRLCLHYDSNIYVEQSAKVVLEQYLSLLQAALTDATKTLASLSLSSETFSQTLKGLEQTKPWPVLGNQDLYPSLFSQAAQTYHQYTALVTDGAKASLPYNELENRSNQLAHYLIAQGVKAESRIALHLDTSLDMVVAILAVLKSGAAFVPLDVHQPAARTLDIIQDAAPEFIIDSQQYGAPSLIEIPTLTLDSTTVDNTLADSALTNRALSDYPTDAPDVTIDADQAAYILFTSGSTGKPKGVVVAHRQLQNYVSSILTRVPLQAGEKSAIVTSLAADLSYTLLFTTLLTGGELHLIERETTLDAQEWARYKTEHAIDNLKVVPSLLDAWLSHGNIAGVLPNKQLILGGEACKPGLLEILSHQSSELQIYNHYGPTEATIGIMMHKAKMPFLAQGLPLSDPLDNTQIYLLDKDLKPVSAGVVAELYIAGASLSRGYLCEKQTAERFLPNPFSDSSFSDNALYNPCSDSPFSNNPFPNKNDRLYPSGDLARYLPDGSIELLGRADRQVKIRGYRIELDEIENLLSSLASVNQAAVVAIPRQQGELQMFAFISLHPEQKGGIAQLQGQLQDRLPDHMIPTLRLLDRLPLMSNGKLNRQSLSQQAAHLLKQSGSIPPRTSLEKTLADLWSDALGLESVGIDDDFFAFGGHSLAAIKLTSRLQSTLGMPVKVNMIFSAPTVAQFALLVEGIKEKEDTIQVEERAIQKSLVRLSNQQEKGLGQQEKYSDQPSQGVNQQSCHKPQLFCFHPSTGHLQDYRHLPELLSQWQLWGLQANDLNDQAETASDTLTTLAENYLIELRQQQPQGPYHLLGWSLGGLLAITVAGLLEAAGEDVAFLGVVDSQATPDDTAQDIGQFLLWAEEEFDQDSRQRLRHLSSVQDNSLVSLLDPAEPKEWPMLLLNWARQQGLQLDNDNWQHAEARQHRHAYTQQLIRSFKPTPLKCPLTAWWAEDTLSALLKTEHSAQLKTKHSALPINWQTVTSGSALIRTIPSHHFDILQQKNWLQQLHDALDQTVSSEPKTPIDPSYDLSYS